MKKITEISPVSLFSFYFSLHVGIRFSYFPVCILLFFFYKITEHYIKLYAFQTLQHFVSCFLLLYATLI